MSVHRKLVSVLLVLLIATVSAVALSICPQMPEMLNLQPQMGMMDMERVQLTFTASQTNLCCHLSVAEIFPVPVRIWIGGEARVIPLFSAVRVSHRDSASGLPDAEPASPFAQARLCVFLI